MSFYDDASLVFLPSGGAGKDGKAYSIKPVPEYGTELVTNGGFDTDSDWTKTNATISGGVATITSTGYAYAAIVQNNVLTIGKTYYATIDVNSIVGGLIVGTSETITSSGIASVTFTATNTYLDIRRDSAFATTTAVIDNVSVREVVVGDGDFTFSRGSNLTATRVDSNGLIEKGRENLLLQSNQFDTTWTTSNSSVTSGQSGYDGSSDAWLLENISSSGAYVKQDKVVNGVQTASVYAKSGNVDYIYLRLGGSSSRGLFVNLSNGTIYSTFGTLIDYNVDSVGNGWYRISVTYEGNHSNFRIYPSASGGTFTSLGDNIYIQDAQLEIGLAATEPILSGASTGLAGILEDSPRFDYSGGASCPSLLLEPSRTNLLSNSEYLEGDSEFKVLSSSVTFADYTETSPDGNENALRILENEGSGNHNWYYDNIEGLTNGTTYCISFFAKSIRGRNIRFDEGGVGMNMQGIIDLSDGSILQDTHNNVSVESYGNGWYRISAVNAMDGTSQRIIFNSVDGTSTSFEGDTTSGVSLWGVQLEEGSYLTSYIPNHSGGSVTREADDLNDLDVSSMLTSSSFTWFLDLNDYIGSDINQELIFLESSPNLKIELRVRPDGYRFYYNNIAGGSTYPIAGSTTANKLCVSYDGNDYRLYVDGVLQATTASVGDSGWDFIKNVTGASLPLKQMLLFPTELSTTDCEILTGATSYESFSAMATALNYTTYE